MEQLSQSVHSIRILFPIIAVWALTIPDLSGRRAPAASDGSVVFRKVTLASRYVSEGAAVADLNRDGKLDIMAGNLWFEGPNWGRHEIASEPKLDSAVDHSNSYLNFADDFDRDGWVDQLLIGRPGNSASWRRNPGKSTNGSAHWEEFPLWRSACNESPHYVNLLETGRKALVMAYDNEYMAWFQPAPNSRHEFISHPISEKTTVGTHKWSHGLGIGDINGDGRKDILCRQGYWEAPEDRLKTPWRFVPADFGPDCAQMHVYDVNADGRPDVVSSSAHAKGVWWYEQRPGGKFIQHTIDDSFSQSHAMAMADLDRDGIMDFVTGKRFWAHGTRGDIEPNHPAVLYWYKLSRKQGTVTWTPHLIDSDSGVGVQFEIADVNRDGLLDIAIANKKGIFYFEQLR